MVRRMSDEEAKRKLLCCVEWEYSNDYAVAVEVAVNALEKQIPKKVTFSGDAYVDGELYYDTASCPACDCVFEDETEFGFNHCPNCGQALDWSDML